MIANIFKTAIYHHSKKNFFKSQGNLRNALKNKSK